MSDALPQRGLVLDNDCFASVGYHLQKRVCFDCLEIAESLAERILWMCVFPSSDNAQLEIADRLKVTGCDTAECRFVEPLGSGFGASPWERWSQPVILSKRVSKTPIISYFHLKSKSL